MSNNFYFQNIGPDPSLLEGKNVIHIGQYTARSCLLRQHGRFYRTVEEMKQFYQNHKEELIIIDDTERSLFWDELYTLLLSAEPMYGHRFIRDEAGYTWYDQEFS